LLPFHEIGVNVSRRAGRMTTAGPLSASAHSRSAARSSGVDVLVGTPKATERAAKFGLDEIDGVGSAVCLALVSTQDAVAAVVDDEQGDGQVMLASGRELRETVGEATVANDRERRLIGKSDRRS
jgi:hypothetical protein